MTDDYRDICHLAAAMEPDARAVASRLAAAVAAMPADKRAWLLADAEALTKPDADMTTRDFITDECMGVANMLREKNAAYGDSAINPVRIFSKADPAEQIRVRIDDKLSRLARGHAAGEDVVLDLLGYLVLLRVMQRRGTK